MTFEEARELYELYAHDEQRFFSLFEDPINARVEFHKAMREAGCDIGLSEPEIMAQQLQAMIDKGASSDVVEFWRKLFISKLLNAKRYEPTENQKIVDAFYADVKKMFEYNGIGGENNFDYLSDDMFAAVEIERVRNGESELVICHGPLSMFTEEMLDLINRQNPPDEIHIANNDISFEFYDVYKEV